MRPAIIKKEKQVSELKEKLSKTSSAILTDYRGLTVKEITDLRRKFRTAGIEYKIIKNNIIFRAVKESDLDALSEYLQGPTAIAFSLNDPVAPVKFLIDFSKEYKKLELKAGIIQGKVLKADELTQVSKLPPKEVLIAQVVGGMKAPLVGVVNVLSAPIRSLVNVLKAIEGKK
ncbi:MAG: 50S ribosomal protein L10 [bacterium]